MLVCLFDFTRSRDVAELHANMTFDPVKINLQQSQYQCERGGRKSVCVETKLCFVYSIKSDKHHLNSSAGEPHNILQYAEVDHSIIEMIPSSFIFPPLHCQSCLVMLSQLDCFLLCPAEIRYDLTLDALRAKARASFFDSDDKSDRKISRSFTIKDRETKCVQETFMMSASTLIFMMPTWLSVTVSHLQGNDPKTIFLALYPQDTIFNLMP